MFPFGNEFFLEFIFVGQGVAPAEKHIEFAKKIYRTSASKVYRFNNHLSFESAYKNVAREFILFVIDMFYCQI